MKKLATVLGAVALTATAANAGGIDRSGQGIGALFEKGRFAELSFGHISPRVSGKDVAVPFGGGATGSVAAKYSQLAFSYKYDVNDQLSFAIIADQPFGAKVKYAATSVALGGTSAVAESTAVTALLRYKLNDRFSVHGGLRAQNAKATVSLRGLAYGGPAPVGLSTYDVNLASDWGLGYVAGVAFERPEIALRVALTYNSAVKHKFNTIETGLPGALAALNGVPTQTNVKTPQSVNLDFQSGVAKDTLVFGQIRWVEWSKFKLAPTGFSQTPNNSSGLINLENTITYSLGVGRRFNETWSGSVSVAYEKAGKKLVSPLAPTNGKLGITLAAVYTKDNMKITTGVNYTKLGDADAQTANTARANFTGNSALGVGVKFGFTF